MGHCGSNPTAIAEAAGAAVRLLRSALLPNPMLVVANAKLAEALVVALEEAGAIEVHNQ
jgi:hypothetical protein